MKFIKSFFEYVLNGFMLGYLESTESPMNLKKAFIGLGIILIIVALYVFLYYIVLKNLNQPQRVLFSILIILGLILIMFFIAIIVEKILKL